MWMTAPQDRPSAAKAMEKRPGSATHRSLATTSRVRSSGSSTVCRFALPAIKRAQKLQKRAASAGFDWKSAKEVLPKLEEEIAELRQALDDAAPRARAAAVLGDLIFSCVNLARHLKVDAEMALRNTNTEFERRFRFIERQLAADGRTVDDADMETLEELWQQAKRGAP